MKKLILAILLLTSFFVVKPVLADDQICTQVYGGGVVCGAHTPVNTGVADNLGLAGVGLTLSSGALFFLSKKFKSA